MSATPELPAGIDFEMLAVDMSEMFGRYGYPIDVCSDDVLPALPAFLADVLANARKGADASWESSGDAATWIASRASDADADPVPQTGAAPEMIYMPWFATQGVEVGARGRHEHYWRCPLCPTWSGPYRDALAAKRPGMDHRWHDHERVKTLRSEAAKVVRKATRNRILIKQYDRLVSQLAARHALDTTTVHEVVACVGRAINRYSRVSELLFTLTREGPWLSEDRAARIAADVATELGREGWLARDGA